MIEREINIRHLRGLLFLDRGPATREELERAIGRYASNTVLSLVARQLVERWQDFYRLTRAGRQVVAQLRELVS